MEIFDDLQALYDNGWEIIRVKYVVFFLILFMTLSSYLEIINLKCHLLMS